MKKLLFLTCIALLSLYQYSYSISDNFAAIGTGIASGIVSGSLYYAGVPSYLAPMAPYIAIATISKNTQKKLHRPGVMITAASLTGALVAGCRCLCDAGAIATTTFKPANDSQVGIALVGGILTAIVVLPALYTFNAAAYTIGSLIPSLITYNIWDYITQ